MNRKLSISLTLASALIVSAIPLRLAHADSCAQKAQEIANAANAELLSAKSEGDKCVITMRVASKNGQPPRIVTKTVKG